MIVLWIISVRSKIGKRETRLIVGRVERVRRGVARWRHQSTGQDALRNNLIKVRLRTLLILLRRMVFACGVFFLALLRLLDGLSFVMDRVIHIRIGSV